MNYVKNNSLRFLQIKILIIFLFTTLILNHYSVHAAVLHSEPISDNFTINQNENDSQNECTSPICREEATFFQNIINDTADPCDDFYNFVCGKYIANTVVDENVGAAQILQDVQNIIDNALKNELSNYNGNDPNFVKKVKQFYKTCQQNATQERVNELLQILNSVGGIPALLGNQWNETSFDWMETVFKLKDHGFSVNFPVKIEVETLDATQRNISIALPDLEYFGPMIYSEREELQNQLIRNHYRHIVNYLSIKLGINETAALAEMEDVSNFARSLLNIHLAEMNENPNGEPYFTPIKFLKHNLGSIPWIYFFKNLTLSADIEEDEEIITQSYRSLKNLTSLIQITPKRVIANYIMLWAIIDVKDHLPSEFFQQYSPQNRQTLCWDTTRDYFGYGLSALYVQKFVKNGTRESADPLIENIKREFKKVLQTNSWMDSRTKSMALEKFEATEYIPGYPYEYFDNDKLNEFYVNFEINNASFLKTFLNARKHDSTMYIATLRKPVSRTDWTQLENLHSEEINSYNYQPRNRIEIAAASLLQPLFEATRPQYLNYGILGSIIGHEISHGFGYCGRIFDKIGNISYWWSTDTLEKFEIKSKCFNDQYNNHTTQPSKHVLDDNGTLEENIADNGGLKTAYRAYTYWINHNNITEPLLPGLRYNPLQMFWISSAAVYCAKYDPNALKENMLKDVHSPGEARVNVGFSNFKEFAEDFKCTLGSAMNPVNKCDLW